MATEAQMLANQRNAAQSTGPRTLEGKAQSRRNSTKHGLTGIIAEVAVEPELMDDLYKAWSHTLMPRTDEEDQLVERIAMESLRIKRCYQKFVSLCRTHRDRARNSWDVDRRFEAEEIANRIASRPRYISRKLERTWHGCDLKIEMWGQLRDSLTHNTVWSENQRSQALDLLGIPIDARDHITKVDSANDDLFEIRMQVIEQELERIVHLRDNLMADLDQADRDDAAASVGAEFTKEGQLLHRYERESIQAHNRAWNRFKALRNPLAEAAEFPPARPEINPWVAEERSFRPHVPSMPQPIPVRAVDPEPPPPLPPSPPPIASAPPSEPLAIAPRTESLTSWIFRGLADASELRQAAEILANHFPIDVDDDDDDQDDEDVAEDLAPQPPTPQSPTLNRRQRLKMAAQSRRHK
jgi:hypothetical protein